MEVFTLILLWLLEIALVAVAITTLYFGLMGFWNVPWVRTSKETTREMLKMADLKPGEKMIDYGCGDGTSCIVGAKEFGATAEGVEIIPLLVYWGNKLAKWNDVEDKVQLKVGDMFKKEPNDADVVFLYLFTETNAKLEPILKKHCRPGTRVITRVFSFPTLPLKEEKVINGDKIRLYIIP